MSEGLSVIIPCFNEADSIGSVLSELSDELKMLNISSEIIAVDDCSTDKTLDVLDEHKTSVRIEHHSNNKGYGASLKTGIAVAQYEYILTMDGDGQHSVDKIADFLELVEGCDMVIGARNQQGSHHWRMPGKFMLRKICEILTGEKIPDINSGFRVFRRSVITQFLHMCSDQFSFSTSSTLALMCNRYDVRFEPIDVKARQSGRSAVSVATGFSTYMLILRVIGTFNPLKIYMPPAIFLIVAGVALLIHGVLHSNITDITLIFLIMGVILFCFGLLADQIALVRKELNRK
jgi:glycosyltransferase involved in cell wall biosynthesis